jgi:hypothetical protein
MPAAVELSSNSETVGPPHTTRMASAAVPDV